MFYFIAIVVGFLMTNAGFWMNHEKDSPAAIWGLVVMLVGLGLTFGGVLLYCVPDFFSS